MSRDAPPADGLHNLHGNSSRSVPASTIDGACFFGFRLRMVQATGESADPLVTVDLDHVALVDRIGVLPVRERKDDGALAVEAAIEALLERLDRGVDVYDLVGAVELPQPQHRAFLRFVGEQ